MGAPSVNFKKKLELVKRNIVFLWDGKEEVEPREATVNSF